MLKFHHHYRAYTALLTFLLLAGCETSPTPKEHAIGEAFAGPANLEIRKELVPKSGVAAIVHYGDKLQILQQHRKLMKVRTASGAEGWVDERMLLDAAAIKALQQLSQDTKKYPSQGKATTYDVLNVHTDPSRTSPSYLEIQAGEKVDVIGHKLAPRAAPPRKPLVIAPRKVPRAPRAKRKEKNSRIPLPNPPAAPKPPPDWVALSKERTPPPEPAKDPDEKNAPGVEAPEDWTLIRNSRNQSGWVLTRKIYMAIPDEVAQYAEGKRITSYFSLGKVIDDEKGQKDIWLWTTIAGGVHPYDFDSFRVFIWNAHRHRYETAYIERRIEGTFPVLASPGKFTVTVNGEQRSFELQGNRILPVH